MKNSPATFQRLIHLVCASDDVVIYTDAWTDRIVILEPVFQWLTQASLTLNYAKCEIGKAIVTYLAKQVDFGQVCSVEAKVTVILNYSVLSSLSCFFDRMYNQNQQLMCWVLLGQDYHLVIKYKKSLTASKHILLFSFSFLFH